MSLLTMQGRINRLKYFIYCLILFIVFFSTFFISKLGDSGRAISLIIYILYLLIGAFVTVRRLHDIEKSGWYYWLFYVPFVNIVLFLMLLFQKGTIGTNKYGLSPLEYSSDVNIKVNSFEDYCPYCIHFDVKTGVCSEIHDNVRDYHKRFSRKCNSKFFIKDPNKNVEEECNK